FGKKAFSLLRRATAPSLGLEEAVAKGWWGPLDGPRPGYRAGSLIEAAPSSEGAEKETGRPPAAKEAATLRLQLSEVHAAIAQRNAALAMLPGSSQLEDDLTSAGKEPSSKAFDSKVRHSSLSLRLEGVMEDDGFIAVHGWNACPGQDAYTRVALDIQECKQMCRGGVPSGQTCGAFVVRQGRAHFKQQSIAECRQKMVEDPESIVYLNSDPEGRPEAETS
ncbi:unnamed protein product, partial [Polarella glacialis]